MEIVTAKVNYGEKVKNIVRSYNCEDKAMMVVWNEVIFTFLIDKIGFVFVAFRNEMFYCILVVLKLT